MVYPGWRDDVPRMAWWCTKEGVMVYLGWRDGVPRMGWWCTPEGVMMYPGRSEKNGRGWWVMMRIQGKLLLPLYCFVRFVRLGMMLRAHSEVRLWAFCPSCVEEVCLPRRGMAMFRCLPPWGQMDYGFYTSRSNVRLGVGVFVWRDAYLLLLLCLFFTFA